MSEKNLSQNSSDFNNQPAPQPSENPPPDLLTLVTEAFVLAADRWLGQQDAELDEAINSTSPEQREQIAKVYNELANDLTDWQISDEEVTRALLVGFSAIKDAIANKRPNSGYSLKTLNKAKAIFFKLLIERQPTFSELVTKKRDEL